MTKQSNKLKAYRKEGIFYIALILATALLFGWISRYTDAGLSQAVESQDNESAFSVFTGFVKHHAASDFGLMLLQIIVILVVARGFAWLFTKVGQPAVIGEIIAGIALGPSILGLIAPGLFTKLFPVESIDSIALLSQFGLILFMFVIGMELDLSEIKKRFRQTVVISHAGIIIPFILGAVAAVGLYGRYASEETPLLPFVLFIGISMSITAFPVLARILQERGEMKSNLGIITLASAANGDITAWCLLAMILAISQAGSAASIVFTLLFAALYLLAMFLLIKPLFKVIGNAYTNTEIVGKGVVSLLFLTMLVSAYVTELLGLHALFGAFIAGVIMPEDHKFRRIITEKVEDVAHSIFLPLFFVVSGLRTEIGLLNSWELWFVTLLLILVAVVGKLGGSYIAARVVGENVKDSLYLGILMNTRGLMELVVLTMGLELGIIPPVVFAMLVLMTLVTTFMTTPTVSLIDAIYKRIEKVKQKRIAGVLHVFFSFGRTETGMAMIYTLHSLLKKRVHSADIMALHMTVGSDINPIQASAFKEASFKELNSYKKENDIKVEELYEVTDNPVKTILKRSEESEAQLLLVGVGHNLSAHPDDKQVRYLEDKYKAKFKLGSPILTALFNTQLLREKTSIFIKEHKGNVGVLMDKGFKSVSDRVLIIKESPEASEQTRERYQKLISALADASFVRSAVEFSSLEAKEDELKKYDLVVLSQTTWEKHFEASPALIQQLPTTLILYPKSDI
ncbi:cation:proton antiporter [Porphyromonas sp. COT-108 OH2963]|uniref:cation:proton antiporter n=1 Tax=Porphyromonas sp. COT-108 OH2963 TaxID=1515614 RepID=UPI00068A0373|nr:cation:proton antiporter [Porphyromonas sp. COT-108 OH2963]